MRLQSVFTVFLIASLVGPAYSQKKQPAAVVGRWDLVVHGTQGDYPSWLEVRRSGRSLVGSFVGQFGSARPIGHVLVDKGHIRFTLPPQFEPRRDNLIFDGTLADGSLRGETTGDKGKRITWEGHRAAALKRTQPPRWGEPVELFNGHDLVGWKARTSGSANGWAVRAGVLVNVKPGNDLVSERTFSDFKLHAKFRYPKESNSGIYLRGRYEVQIEDGYGQEPDSHGIGGVYGFLTPSVNAAKKPGEWQTMDITLRGRQVTVVFNGQRIIDRQSIPGITGGALDSDEAKPGPIMLQGDHGQVEFRKVTLIPGQD